MNKFDVVRWLENLNDAMYTAFIAYDYDDATLPDIPSLIEEINEYGYCDSVVVIKKGEEPVSFRKEMTKEEYDGTDYFLCLTLSAEAADKLGWENLYIQHFDA